MKNTIGNNISVTLFGESHGSAIGAVIDGLAPGISISRDYIDNELKRRRPKSAISTSRREADEYSFVSGVRNGLTTGTPLCVLIPNKEQDSSAYENIKNTPRPSSADYTGYVKYNGFNDPRGGGHFSGRLTAALVLAGAILRSALEAKGIFIGSHIKTLGSISDRDFICHADDVKYLKDSIFPVLNESASEKMQDAILCASKSGDSVGGIIESIVLGMPCGIGEPWFDTVEGCISKLLFSIPGIKGVEFGSGFALCSMKGSEANDRLTVDNGVIITKTNHGGGVDGGITNGMPILFRSVVKPTASISKEQTTVDLTSMEEATIKITGRHDPAIVHRACAVVDAVTAIALADLLATAYGTNWLRGDKK